jgi:hypothetical protein
MNMIAPTIEVAITTSYNLAELPAVLVCEFANEASAVDAAAAPAFGNAP